MSKDIDSLVENARNYLGVKWQHNQSSMYAVDCLRFWEKLVREANPNLELIPDCYGRNEPISKIKDYLNRNFKKKQKIEKGNIILFNYSGCPHLGLVSNVDEYSPIFIHASYKYNKVVENRFNDKFKKHYVGTWKIFDD